MVRLIFFIFIFISFFSNTYSDELNSDEKKIFNFFDLNKDNSISFDEINKSLTFLFTLIDVNNDNKISEEEIIELKNIIDSFS